MQNIETSISNKLDTKINDLQQYFDREMNRFVSRLEDQDKRLKKLEELQQQKAIYDPETTIVAIGFQQQADEDIEEKVGIMVREGLRIRDAPVVRATRLPSRNNKPGLVKIQFNNVDTKVAVLREKQRLKNFNGYERVFLHSSKSHIERVAELNFQMLLGLIPGGDDFPFTGSGRLVPRDEEYQHRMEYNNY